MLGSQIAFPSSPLPGATAEPKCEEPRREETPKQEWCQRRHEQHEGHNLQVSYRLRGALSAFLPTPKNGRALGDAPPTGKREGEGRDRDASCLLSRSLRRLRRERKGRAGERMVSCPCSANSPSQPFHAPPPWPSFTCVFVVFGNACYT